MQDISTPSLYKTNDDFELIISTDHNEWLKNRSKRVGGSEASSLVEKNKYQSLRELWFKKTSNNVNELPENELIKYGNDCEPILRKLFAIKHSNVEVQYMENVSLYSKQYDYMAYSPDGLLLDGERKGILEIKTSFIRNSNMLSQWKDNIPINYFIQVLWGLIVTGYDFVDLIAELRFLDGDSQIKQYHIERIEVIDDIEWLIETATNNWNNYFVSGIEPPMTFEL